jgi:hypothetical protein
MDWGKRKLRLTDPAQQSVNRSSERRSTRIEVPQRVGRQRGVTPEGETYPEERASRAAHIPRGARPRGSTRGLAGALALPAVGERRLQSRQRQQGSGGEGSRTHPGGWRSPGPAAPPGDTRRGVATTPLALLRVAIWSREGRV